MGAQPKHSPEQIEEVVRLAQSCGPTKAAEKLGMKPRAVARIAQKHNHPPEGKPYRVPHFDGWDFIHDNLDLGRHQ